MKTWTIIELLKETQLYFTKKGIKTSRLDAELLLSHCLKKDRVKLYMDFESPVTSEELVSFRQLVRRRAKREPISYILGYKEFWSMKIRVTRDVLIPRPETEILVEETVGILSRCNHDSRLQKVLELGTGSGAISLALAKEKDHMIVFTVDISPKALKVAKDNITQCKLDNRIFLVCGNFLEPFIWDESFDIVVSNPPYICTKDIERLEPEIKDHEPRCALDGGKDGLSFYREWIPQLPALLKTNAWIALELGDGQAQAVFHLLSLSGFYKNIRIAKDYAQLERVILAQKK